MKIYFIKTFGCQMNEADSEKLAAVMEKQGYLLTPNIGEADIVVINTCSVRESAENRVFGLVNNLAKKKKKGQKIILTGCMLRYPLRWLKEKLPAVDEFRKVSEFQSAKSKRESKTHAWVPIMEGCSHYCTYCVVPYARGPEKSRPFEEIVCEVEELGQRGYKEITLLGQNVNSYKPSFAKLLRRLHEIERLQRISFMTSNPWDLTDDIIEAMALPKIDRYLHLPVQSGDNEILKKMNRPYTVKQYLALVQKIRKRIPDIKIGTDIIVGFPSETKEAFENTVKLCREVGFEKAYLAQYSPRPGTVAFRLKDDVSHREKKRRWQILENMINKRRLLIICGPTATGKTKLGIYLAKKFNGELISADSRQVYQGMDIGTGKDHPKAVKINLINVVKPNEEFSVSQYYQLVWQTIKKIWKKGKLPILIGGSGFYIKGVIDGVETFGVPPDWKLRKKLGNLEIEKLREKLQKLAPERWERMNKSDRQNPRRLVRAIEIALQIPNSKFQIRNKFKVRDVLFIGLRTDYKTLYQRIDQRVEERVKQGMFEEIKNLLARGYSWENSVLGTTIGYREWRSFFEKKATQEEVIQKWQFAEHAYARRQMTWFKKDKRINWFDITKEKWQDEVESLIYRWYYRKNGPES